MKIFQNHGLVVYAIVAAFFVSVLPGLSPGRAGFAQNISPAGFRSAYNVRDFGAKGDGKALDSPAVNKAIDAAAANGGGTVFFPAGTYRSFSIHLKSNITLYFDQGSVLL